MNVIITFYVLYFLVSVAAIHGMARTLSKTSTSYLLEAFHGNSDLVLRVDRVIIGSFFLANVGFVVSNAPYSYLDHIATSRAIALLLEKLGSAMLFLGFTLFVGLWIFARMRRLETPASMTR